MNLQVNRRAFGFVHDVAATGIAVAISFYLRLGGIPDAETQRDVVLATIFVAIVAVPVLIAVRLDRTPWGQISASDWKKIVLVASVLSLCLIVLAFFGQGSVFVPRTVPFIFLSFEISLLAGNRVLYRVYREQRRDRRDRHRHYRQPVLIAGRGSEAKNLITQLRNDVVAALDPVGVISHRERDVGTRIQQVPVLGTFRDLDRVVAELARQNVAPRRLILTSEGLGAYADLDGLIEAARDHGIPSFRPRYLLSELGKPDGAMQLEAISIEDLLGRSAFNLDLKPLRSFIAGRRVLVTGAGGSIGSELCRQIAAHAPEALMLFEVSELSIYTITTELRRSFEDLNIEQYLGSVCDRDDVFDAFQRFKPALVFHAAALKHVDIVEKHPVSAAHTNAIGTRHVADACTSHSVNCAVFISTDKAVNPVSILGATKRAGELYWAVSDQLARSSGQHTRFVTVRFGNVLGSSGSVIPHFKEQIRRGGPLTITHPDIERYFMMISEAVTLVLMASRLGGTSETLSPLYILDMGKPVKILDLAKRMIRLANLEPEKDIRIVITGLRPGERLREELEFSNESLQPTTVPGVRTTENSTATPDEVLQLFSVLEDRVADRNASGIFAALKVLVPQYRPTEVKHAAAPSAESRASEVQRRPELSDLELSRSRPVH